MRDNKKYLLLCFCLPILLSSCSVGTKYVRTDLELPENYRDHTTVTGDTLLLPWKIFFKDPMLTKLIEKALEKNSEISNAVLSVRQMDLLYRQAKLQLLPSIDLNAGGSRNWFSKNSANALSGQVSKYSDDYNAALNLSWEADIWGKAGMQKEDALAGFFAQKENLSALKTRIIVQVAQAYYNLLTLDEQLVTARRNTELCDSTLRIIRLQFNSGQENSIAVELAEGQKKTAELLMPVVMQNIVVQENALNILCGSYPDSVERSGYASAALPDEVLPSGVPAMLLSRRLDLKAAEWAVVSANAKSGLAKAAMYPSFSLTASSGINSSLWNKWFDLPGSLFENLSANLTQPLFQRNALKSAYDIADIERQKAAVQFRQAVMTAVSEVSDAMARSKYASEQMNLLAQKKIALSKALYGASLLYKNGKASYLEVITVENNSLQNELEIINAKRDKFNAVTDLYRALGGGAEN